MTADSTTSIFPKGEKLTNGYFTGDAYLTSLLARDKNNDFVLGSVTFEPSARTNRSAVRWHTHTKGQGFTRKKAIGPPKRPAQRVKKGDVINIPEQVEHGHGASATYKLVHIAITNYRGDSNVVWLTPVSDEDYTQANEH